MYGLDRIYARLDQPQITDIRKVENRGSEGRQTHERDCQKSNHCRCHMDEVDESVQVWSVPLDHCRVLCYL
jgi:hypothetical protein